MTIAAGAAVIDARSDTVGNAAGSQGVLLVNSGGALSDANLSIGQNGSGTLFVNGGTVITGSLDTGNTGSGIIALSGAGSELNDNGSATIGDSGAGTLSILSGATMTGTGMTIGSQAGGTASSPSRVRAACWTWRGPCSLGTAPAPPG